MTKATPPIVELDELISLFYRAKHDLGEFERCLPNSCPQAYGSLLEHEAHMTVTVEQRHGCSVGVEVLESQLTETHYNRKILLRRTSDSRVVQFGIVRLSLAALQPQVRDEIMQQQTPLGRVLIQHNVLRQVHLNAIWRVECAGELAEHMMVDTGHETYGRTALIFCDGEPAVELLEIVAPEDTF
ncbi:MAG: hypothetical protein AB8B50_01815 [Pirellulaceae bacterium]